ncbi:hypothetical protein MKW92_006032, partial [Papaver armeniacum]
HKQAYMLSIIHSFKVLAWWIPLSCKAIQFKEISWFRLQDACCGSQNTIVAEPGIKGIQAVALRITGDRAVFYNVRFLGYQDTLYDHEGTHYYYNSFIQGEVDFIFGNERSLFENCTLNSVAKVSGFIAALHRNSEKENTGFSFVNSKISGTGKMFLERAWGDYSRTVYIRTYMSSIIMPEGWNDWGVFSRRDGRGSLTSARVKWSKNFTQEEIHQFEDKHYIDGQEWLRL